MYDVIKIKHHGDSGIPLFSYIDEESVSVKFGDGFLDYFGRVILILKVIVELSYV